jgi:hypothetical protein
LSADEQIERVQQAQDKFVADLIEAEYDDEEEIIDEDEEVSDSRGTLSRKADGRRKRRG